MLIALILLSVSVFAITATTLSGMIQMGLEDVPTTFEKSIGVKNENNKTVQVKFIPDDKIADMVVMEAYNITLEPQETRFVKFNLTATEMKKTVGSIIIVFSDSSVGNATEEKFAVSTAVVVFPKGPNAISNVTVPANISENNVSSNLTNTSAVSQPDPSTSTPVKTGTIIILAAGLVLLILAAIIIINLRKGAKNE